MIWKSLLTVRSNSVAPLLKEKITPPSLLTLGDKLTTGFWIRTDNNNSITIPGKQAFKVPQSWGITNKAARREENHPCPDAIWWESDQRPEMAHRMAQAWFLHLVQRQVKVIMVFRSDGSKDFPAITSRGRFARLEVRNEFGRAKTYSIAWLE